MKKLLVLIALTTIANYGIGATVPDLCASKNQSKLTLVSDFFNTNIFYACPTSSLDSKNDRLCNTALILDKAKELGCKYKYVIKVINKSNIS